MKKGKKCNNKISKIEEIDLETKANSGLLDETFIKRRKAISAILKNLSFLQGTQYENKLVTRMLKDAERLLEETESEFVDLQVSNAIAGAKEHSTEVIESFYQLKKD